MLQKNKSITFHLVLLYTISTLILFSIFGGMMFWVMKHSLDTATSQYMIDEVYVIRDLLKQHNGNLNSLEQEVKGVPSNLKHASYHYYIRIYQNTDKPLLETPGYLPVLKDSSTTESHSFPFISAIVKKSLNGKQYIILKASIQHNLEASPLYMDMALDMSFQSDMIKDFLLKLIFILIGISILIIILGYAIARRGLASLQKITALTNKISPDQLSERLRLENWPAELSPLVDAINSMLASLEASFNRLSECSAELAHELRTPITNLMLETESVLTQKSKAADYEKVLASNSVELQKLSLVINNILFLARSVDPRLAIHKKMNNIDKELNRIVEFFSILASEKNIDIQLNAEEFFWTVDIILFERAISKLLENAIEFTNQDGKITINLTKESDSMQISVIDNGIGIQPDRISKLMENQFYRVNYSDEDKNNNAGLGLGLKIVKTVMDLHKGSMTITSQPGIGTEIQLAFRL